jgi:hypothetical protein
VIGILKPMRALLGTVAAISVLCVLAPATASARASKPPTQAQIRAAVRRAERSRQLWATVNICRTPRFGVRGQMPGLGFASDLSMKIQVDYWSFAKKRFVPLRGVSNVVSLGTAAQDLHQAGSVWRFKPPAILSGTITFQWRRGNRLIGETTRLTAHGVKGVDDADPKGNSTATCRMLGPS